MKRIAKTNTKKKEAIVLEKCQAKFITFNILEKIIKRYSLKNTRLKPENTLKLP